uniref:Uncharacterized protein n=1 Tax=Riptortus pedestris TaxID=329032 RepID=R4WMW8_RIPPE|nr:unknown secreted protein [Riptortus pedestris]
MELMMQTVKAILLVVSLAGVAMGKPALHDINGICDKISDYFNIITELAPIYATFDQGSGEDGEPLPPVTVELEPAAHRLSSCYVTSGTSRKTIKLSFNENLKLNMSEQNIRLEGCEISLHFSVGPETEKGISAKPALVEVSSLGKATLEDGTDFTDEAESLVRPLLFDAFNSFVKEHFTLSLNADFNRSTEALVALQFLFKEVLQGLPPSNPPQ